MSAADPGALRRLALRAFKLVPATPSYMIMRRFTPSFTMGAAAILEHEGHLLALRQLHRTGWSLPGGLLDRGEEPHEAVVREVLEETGLHITPGDVFATVFDAHRRHVDVIFRVRCEQRPQVEVASEALEARWFTVDELPEPDDATRRILRAVRAARSQPQPGRVLGPPASAV